MTDKEKLDAIRAEIHRLVDVRGYDRGMANDLFAFINSLPNEPISNDLKGALKDYAYQVAYDLSHDWLKENATWDDVETAVKLGAEWNERHHKPTWSEEDEKMIGRVRGIIEAYAFSQSAVDVNGDLCEKKFIDVDIWLKSLKDRVQPKQEWSEEDEKKQKKNY